MTDSMQPASDRAAPLYDVAVVGGGPSGASAAERLARAGRSVLLLDRAGRIKPCGGAIPPRLVRDFDIPERLLAAKVRSARMISPKGREVIMPIDGGYVGMVDREVFDEWLRDRAASAGTVRETGVFERIERPDDGPALIRYRAQAEGETSRTPRAARAKLVVGADGAASTVAKGEGLGEARRQVIAYHEILETPDGADVACAEVIYDGRVSPDFYGWVFPHGPNMSVGMGTAERGVSLKDATGLLRRQRGLTGARTIRVEGAPIPLKPLKRWDNGRDVLLAGDAAGVVAPSSGEGIYYAMLGGVMAADAVEAALQTGDARELKGARKAFMREHGKVFWILGMMQHFWYKNDRRRERFVSLCEDPDIQRLTWQAYMNKKLVKAGPRAHARIFVKDMAHLLGLVRP